MNCGGGGAALGAFAPNRVDTVESALSVFHC